MTPEQIEQLAAEAKRIMENDAAVKALADMRADALESMATANPTDADAIRQQQAMVKAVDGFFDKLKGFIARGSPKSKPGIA